MATITLTINQTPVSCPSDTSILDAALQNGIPIPTLCHHPELKPYGACRICLVEDKNTGRLLASCVTPAAPDMQILTDSPRVTTHRRNILRLMIAEHPESCVVCNKGNSCRLRYYAAQMGIGETHLYPMPNYKPFEEANPFIVRDLSKCILCGKCIRADHELVAVGAIDYSHRGFPSRPATLHEQGLERSECIFCGTCVSMCPTGALAVNNNRYAGTAEKESLSVCGFCSVGCQLSLGTVAGQVIEVNPASQIPSVNGATLCVRGHFAHDFLNATDRLSQPMVRKSKEDGASEQTAVTWHEALETAAERLLSIKKTYGPQSIAFLGSTKCSNEENYLFQKMCRALLASNNIDNGGTLYGRSAWHRLEKLSGGGLRVNRFADLEKAGVIFLIQADPGASAPVLSYYLKRASEKGIPVILANSRPSDLDRVAHTKLPCAPGAELDLLNGLAALLLEQNLHALSFIDRFTEGFSLVRMSLSSLDMARVYHRTGLNADQLKRVSKLIAGERISFVVGSTLLLQDPTNQVVDSLFNLSLLIGSLGKPGSGLYLIARENNQVGAWDMGTTPDQLPGRQELSQESARKKWEHAWQVSISPDKGLGMNRMLREAQEGNLKALYVMGENPLRSLPQTEQIRDALAHLDLLIVQDILHTSTSRQADIVLPGCAFAEKEGSFTNMEGRIQGFSPAATPPGEAVPDWDILARLMQKMKSADVYNSIEDVRNEIRTRLPQYNDLPRGTGVGWLQNSQRMQIFNPEGKGEAVTFAPVAMGAEDTPPSGYPLRGILVNGRYHLGSGTRTARSVRIQAQDDMGRVVISPDDGHQFNLDKEGPVAVTSPHGSFEGELRFEPGMAPGQALIYTASNGNAARNILPLYQDEPGNLSRSEASRSIWVRIETI